MKTKIILILGFLAIITSGASAETTGYEPHPVFSATYSVPTNLDLATYATWKLKNIKFVKNGDNISAKYTMPGDLLEETSQEISMSGKVKSGAPFFTMNGDHVQAACSELGKDSYVCLLKFKKTGMKMQNKDDYFKHNYSDSTEAQKRNLVAQVFTADPIGILRIEKQ